MNQTHVERNHGRARAIRWSIYGGVPGLILLIYFVAWVWPLEKVAIEVGPETTYLTEPVRDDGSIDYVAAINARGENIPHEDNAAALLIRVLDPADLGPWGVERIDMEPDQIQGLYDWFGLTVPNESETERQFVSWEEFHGNLPVDQQISDSEDLPRRLWTAPWDVEEYPQVADWLERNESALAFIIQASRRPKFFWPVVPDETGTLLSAHSPPRILTTQCIEALLVRAQMRIGRGAPESFVDIQAAVRLGALFRAGGRLRTIMAGTSAVRRANSAIDDWLLTSPDDQRILDLLKAFVNARPRRPNAEWLEYARMEILDAIQSVYTGRIADASSTQRMNRRGADFDVNAVLRRANDWLSRVDEPGWSGDFDRFAERTRDYAESWRAKVLLWVAPAHVRRSVETEIAMLLLVVPMPELNRPKGILRYGDAEMVVAKAALAVAAYRAERGAYPETLDALVPAYLDAVPDDPYGEGTLGYERMGDDAAKVWSIGPDGVDQGGVDDRPADEQRRDAPHDIVFELGPPGAE